MDLVTKPNLTPSETKQGVKANKILDINKDSTHDKL